MTRRQLLAFKRPPTVELRLDDLSAEIRDDRVHLAIGTDATAWFSWDEWRDFARRVEHSIVWIEANTPDDVSGSSFKVGDGAEQDETD